MQPLLDAQREEEPSSPFSATSYMTQPLQCRPAPTIHTHEVVRLSLASRDIG